jgi:hypothetical protein
MTPLEAGGLHQVIVLQFGGSMCYAFWMLCSVLLSFSHSFICFFLNSCFCRVIICQMHWRNG